MEQSIQNLADAINNMAKAFKTNTGELVSGVALTHTCCKSHTEEAAAPLKNTRTIDDPKHPGSIKRKDAEAAAEAVAALEAEPNIAYLLANSEHQVLVMGEYLEAGTGLTIPVKALIDIVPGAQEDFYGATLADLKTCRSAGLRAWTRTVADGNLHWQAALYLDLYNAATGECRESFLHVLSESSAPYQTGRRILSLEFIEAGRLAYRTALSHYATCLKSARWPDYEGVGALNGWTFVEPEPWMVSLTLPPPPEEEEETPAFVSEFPS